MITCERAKLSLYSAMRRYASAPRASSARQKSFSVAKPASPPVTRFCTSARSAAPAFCSIRASISVTFAAFPEPAFARRPASRQASVLMTCGAGPADATRRAPEAALPAARAFSRSAMRALSAASSVGGAESADRTVIRMAWACISLALVLPGRRDFGLLRGLVLLRPRRAVLGDHLADVLLNHGRGLRQDLV